MKVAAFLCDKVIGVGLMATGAVMLYLGYQKFMHAGVYIFSKFHVDI